MVMKKIMLLVASMFLLAIPTVLAPPSIVDWWKFKEGSGNIIANEFYPVPCERMNSADWIAGVNNYALRYDGINDWVNCTNSPFLDFDPVDTFTIKIWVRAKHPMTSCVDGSTIYHKAIPPAPVFPASVGYWLYLLDTCQPQFIASDSFGGAVILSTPSSPNVMDGYWHQIVILRNVMHWEMWIDKIPIVTADTPVGSLNNVGELSVGSIDGLGLFFDGDIDEFEIFNYALSPPEIAMNYDFFGYTPLYQEYADSLFPETLPEGYSACSVGMNVIDGDWDTYDNAPECGMDYIKPFGATGAIWQVKDEYPMPFAYNITIPDSCFNYDPDELYLYIDEGGAVGWQCYDGAWEMLSYHDVNSIAYEEGIYWIFNSTVEISDCSVLDQIGATYYLTADITDSSESTCMDITGTNITLDCQNYIIDGDTSGDAGISTGEGSIVKNCRVSDFDKGVRAGSNNVEIDNCELFRVTYGVDLSAGSNVVVKNSNIYDYTQEGIVALPETTNNIDIYNNIFTGSGDTRCVRVETPDNSSNWNIYDNNCTLAWSSGVTNQIGFYLYYVDGFNVSNNDLSNVRTLIDPRYSSNGIVENNRIISSRQISQVRNAQNITFINNFINSTLGTSSPRGMGFSITASSSDIHVLNNTAYGTGGFITTFGGANNIEVKDNDFYTVEEPSMYCTQTLCNYDDTCDTLDFSNNYLNNKPMEYWFSGDVVLDNPNTDCIMVAGADSFTLKNYNRPYPRYSIVVSGVANVLWDNVTINDGSDVQEGTWITGVNNVTIVNSQLRNNTGDVWNIEIDSSNLYLINVDTGDVFLVGDNDTQVWVYKSWDIPFGVKVNGVPTDNKQVNVTFANGTQVLLENTSYNGKTSSSYLHDYDETCINFDWDNYICLERDRNSTSYTMEVNPQETVNFSKVTYPEFTYWMELEVPVPAGRVNDTLSDVGQGVGNLLLNMSSPMAIFIILLSITAMIGFVIASVGKGIGGKV
jgi:hypothetical protein